MKIRITLRDNINTTNNRIIKKKKGNKLRYHTINNCTAGLILPQTAAITVPQLFLRYKDFGIRC